MGKTETEALVTHNLAPLSTRRDMAMLGLIHRTVLKLGPPQFNEWFYPCNGNVHSHNTRWQCGRHDKILHDYVDGDHTMMLQNSVLGLVSVYNGLPQEMVNAKTVSKFQGLLQDRLKTRAVQEMDRWSSMYSPRKVRV